MKPNKNGNMCCGAVRCDAMYGFLQQIQCYSVYLHTKYERKEHLNTCVMVPDLIMQYAWAIYTQ